MVEAEELEICCRSVRANAPYIDGRAKCARGGRMQVGLHHKVLPFGFGREAEDNPAHRDEGMTCSRTPVPSGPMSLLSLSRWVGSLHGIRRGG